jgi:hypothetical protein
MKIVIFTIVAVASIASFSGSSAVCSPTGIGTAAGYGMQSGSLGITGFALAGIEIGACAAYHLTSSAIDAGKYTPEETGQQWRDDRSNLIVTPAPDSLIVQASF